jgi:hypothetical protein
VENYSPSGGKPIESIAGVFASRFMKQKGGIAGRLNPQRKNPLWSNKRVISHNFKKEVSVDSDAEDRVASDFFPVPEVGFAQSHIDYICKKLNDREFVERGLIPSHQLSAHQIIFDWRADEPYVKLRDEFQLKKIKPGYWSVVCVEVDHTVDERTNRGIRNIGDVLRSTMNQQSCDN